MVSSSLSYIAIVWGVRDYCWLEGFDTWIYLMTLFTTLSYTSPLKLHPDLPWNNSSYSASEYAFHVCLQSHPALPSAPYITHTHHPLPCLSLVCIPPVCSKWNWQRKEPMRLKSFETPGIQMSWEASGNKTRHLKSKRQVNYYPNLGRITKGVSGVPLIAVGPGPECQGFKLHASFGLRPKTCHCRTQQHVQQC